MFVIICKLFCIYIKLHIPAQYSIYIYVMWTLSCNSLSLFWVAVVFLELACCLPPFLSPFCLFSFPPSLLLPFLSSFHPPFHLAIHLYVCLTKGNSRKEDFSSWFIVFRTYIVGSCFSKSSITLRWVCIQKWGEVLIWETDFGNYEYGF